MLTSGARCEGSPTYFSVPSDLLAAATRVDSKRNLPDRLVPTAPPARRNEVAPLGRGDGRRHVFPGQKRGLCVCKTKYSKGTKIMLLIDGRGTPLGVDIASASPAEVNLIEPLLNKRNMLAVAPPAIDL